METGYTRITVRFEDPFWVCLYERGGGGQYEVCRILFGGAPSDGQVYEYLLAHWRALAFSPPIAAEVPAERRVNPKRAHREARRATQPCGRYAGTMAQRALSLQREAGREARKRRSRAEREAEEARRYALREAKRKEKHKGH